MNEQTVQNNDARILLGEDVEFGGTVNRTIHDFRENHSRSHQKLIDLTFRGTILSLIFKK